MKARNIKRLLIVVACLAVLSGSIATTLAWLTGQDQVENVFEPGMVGNYVDEVLEGNAKTSIRIQNGQTAEQANVPAFIRVALVPTWGTEGDEGTRYPAELPTGSDALNDGWFKYGDYYYYSHPVSPLGYTDVMFTGPLTPPALPAAQEGNSIPRGLELRYELDILSQSIQALGTDADGKHTVEVVWGVTYDDGTIGPGA